MMSLNDVNEYHKIIREMIKNENELRNSRNNWFMAIQGLLINASIALVIQDKIILPRNSIYIILIVITALGLITSISFLHAVWRSKRSITMALKCWDLFLISNGKKIQDYPPIALITSGIIKNETKDNTIGVMDWENNLNKMMYGDDDCLKCCDKKRNKLDFLMPFQLNPLIFIGLWFICIVGIVFLWARC